MQETTEKNLNIKVVKRNGKKVDFNGTKIAMAIKKGFDSVEIENAREEELKYSADDANKVYNMVLQDIENSQKDSIKIEEIQEPQKTQEELPYSQNDNIPIVNTDDLNEEDKKHDTKFRGPDKIYSEKCAAETIEKI